MKKMVLAAVLTICNHLFAGTAGKITSTVIDSKTKQRAGTAAKTRQPVVVVKRSVGVVPAKEKAHLQQNHRKITGNESVAPQSFQVLSKATKLTGPGTLIGRTAYNYQTNDNLHDRIIWNPADSTIHTQWIYGDIAETPAFSGRRDRYNYFNGTSWAFTDQGVPIESERSGFGSLAIDADNIAVPVSHVTALNNEGTLAWLDFQPGFGFFSSLKVHRKPDNTQTRLEPLWPDIAIDRQGNFHVIAINNNQETDAQVLNGVLQNIIYWKSTDRGASWGNFRVLFPNTTTYPLTLNNRAGNSQIAVSDTDNRKVGILVTSAYHTLYFFESDDGGDNWKPGVNITGKPRLNDIESLALHPQQFDVIQVDSTDAGGPKYLTFVEWPISNFFFDNGPLDSRPPAPADLIYINGEPHVAWNELFATREFFYPVGGLGYSLIDPAHVSLYKGGNSHIEGGFFIKHWSPSTGVKVVDRYNEATDAFPPNFSHWLTQPQLGRDASGNLYCLYTRYDNQDTLRVQGQRETRGPLPYGEIWGAMSADNGITWNESVRLTQTFNEDERFVGVSDLNPDDVIHVIYQTANIPGTAVGGDNSDHFIWVNAEIRHWAVPTSLFPATPRAPDPEIDVEVGILDFRSTQGTAVRSFTVFNSGNADLVVDSMFIADIGAPDPITAEDFTINPISFTVPPRGTQLVDVTYRAKTINDDTLIFVIPNNDLSEHSRGLVILAAALSVSVASSDAGSIPGQYYLAQNYPNPISLAGASKLASSATEFRYALKANGHTKIRIFDMLGREVAVLVDGLKPAGEHRVTWQPSGLTAGIYFYSLEVNGFRETRKMVLLP